MVNVILLFFRQRYLFCSQNLTRFRCCTFYAYGSVYISITIWYKLNIKNNLVPPQLLNYCHNKPNKSFASRVHRRCICIVWRRKRVQTPNGPASQPENPQLDASPTVLRRILLALRHPRRRSQRSARPVFRTTATADISRSRPQNQHDDQTRAQRRRRRRLIDGGRHPEQAFLVRGTLSYPFFPCSRPINKSTFFPLARTDRRKCRHLRVPAVLDASGRIPLVLPDGVACEGVHLRRRGHRR